MASIQQAMMTYGVGETTPSDFANIWDWWEASREVGLSNDDPMPTLTGQFAGNDWTEADPAHRAIYKTNQINGLAVSQHDPTSFEQGWAVGPDMSALTAGHVFIVVKIDTDPPGTVGFTGLWSMSNNLGETFPTTHYPFTTGSIFDACGSTTRKTVGNPAAALTSWRVYEVVSTSSEWTALLDGTQLFTTGTNTVGFLTNGGNTPRLGRNFDDAAGLDGQIAGMYLFSAKLTGANRTEMIDYINNRFALSSS